MLFQSLKPRFLGKRIKVGLLGLLARLMRIVWLLRNATSGRAAPPMVGWRNILMFNEPVVAMGETASAGSSCSARGLAVIAAMMAARGQWAGEEILSRGGWEALHANPIEADMGFPTEFTQGGVNRFSARAAKRRRLRASLQRRA